MTIGPVDIGENSAIAQSGATVDKTTLTMEVTDWILIGFDKSNSQDI